MERFDSLLRLPLSGQALGPERRRRHRAGRAWLLALAGTTLSAAPALAAGVPAGSLIESTATATYASDAGNGAVSSNTVQIRVDELLDVAVASLGPAVSFGQSGQHSLAFRVTNTGNGPESFTLAASPAVAGNPFDAVVQTIAIDSNANGSYDAGIDQTLASGAATPALSPDSSLTAFVIVTLPADAADGETSQLRLTASATTGTGAAGTVFAGQGKDGGDAVVGTSGAVSGANGQLGATLASVSLTKTARIRDPFGGTDAVPGAVVTYTLTAAISGSGGVRDLRITDPVPAGTTYRAGTLRLDGAVLSDAADADAGTAQGGNIAVTVATAASGSSHTVTFDVQIN